MRATRSARQNSQRWRRSSQHEMQSPCRQVIGQQLQTPLQTLAFQQCILTRRHTIFQADEQICLHSISPCKLGSGANRCSSKQPGSEMVKATPW